MDATIKLLGISKKENENVYAMVAPMFLNSNHPLFNINDVFNGIYVRGNVLGDVRFYGRRAGKLPTARGVVADVVDDAKHVDTNIMTNWSSKKLHLTSIYQSEHRFFVRVKGEKEDNKDKIAEIFGEVTELTPEGISGEYGFVTSKMKEIDYKEKASQLDHILNMIRVGF